MSLKTLRLIFKVIQMKKILFCIILALCLLSVSAAAAEITYKIDGETLTISGDGAMVDYYVNEVYPPWNSRLYTIKHIIIEDGVTYIGGSAFRGLEQLETVTVGADVKEIGSYAFYGCLKLTEINLPEGLQVISNDAFFGCSALDNVTLGDNLKYISDDAFLGTGVYNNQENWSDGMFYIDKYLICGGNNLIPGYVTVRDGTVYIGDLSLCTSLNVMYIPDSVAMLDNSYFPDTVIFEGNKGSAAEAFAEANNRPFFEKGEEHIKTAEGADGIKWGLDFDNRILTLKGQGETAVYDNLDNVAPWIKYWHFVKAFHIGEGITKISGCIYPYWARDFDLHLPETLVAFEYSDKASGVTVYGTADTYAQNFAYDNGYMFIDEAGNKTMGGSCTESVSWSYDIVNGKVTVSGTGVVPDYSSGNAPWSGIDIEEIEFTEGITRIGSYIISAKEMKWAWVIVPNSVTEIDENAFSGNITIYCKKGSAAEALAGGEDIEAYTDYAKYEVETAEEFINAIGSNRKIVLKDGIYTFDETVEIKNCRNLTVTTTTSGGVEILTGNASKPVITLNHCADISVSNFILGYTNLYYEDTSATPSGYVIYSRYSKNVSVTNCDLFGGAAAVGLFENKDFTASGCILRDGAENAVTAQYDKDGLKSNAVFTDCVISGSGAQPNIITDNTDIDFYSCIFINNSGSDVLQESKNGRISFTDCRFYDNLWQELSPKNSGIMLNGITWELVREENEWGEVLLILKLGYGESAKGMILDYSKYSNPWIKYTNGSYIDSYQIAEGVSLGGSGWELKDGVLTVFGNEEIPALTPWKDYGMTVEKIVVAEGVASINYSMFYSCSNVKSIKIGKDVSEIMQNSFSFAMLEEIVADEENRHFSSVDGVLFNKEKTVLIKYPEAKAGVSYSVPQAVTEIADSGISGYGLRKIIIPPTVTKIGEDGLPSTALIVCEEGSAAMNYAIDNGLSYTFIDNIVVAAKKEQYNPDTNEARVTFTVCTPDNEGSVTAALYNTKGKLVALKQLPVTGDNISIEFLTESNGSYINWSYVKILWWNKNTPLGNIVSLNRYN